MLYKELDSGNMVTNMSMRYTQSKGEQDWGETNSSKWAAMPHWRYMRGMRVPAGIFGGGQWLKSEMMTEFSRRTRTQAK